MIARSSSAPTRAAGSPPICAHVAASGTGASGIHCVDPDDARLTPSTGNSAHALYAFTVTNE